MSKMPCNKMKISIVTATFNSGKTILRTLDSILSQSYNNIECIFIDNESSDDTVSIIHDKLKGYIDYKVISEKDSGISEAFSKGIQYSTGEIIGILNSDDVYYGSTSLERVVRAFGEKDIDFVHGDMIFEDESYGSDIRRPLLCPLIYAMPYNHPTFFVRKKIYDEIGTFKFDYRYAMDFELICRMYSDCVTPKFNGSYIKGEPLVRMFSGGASWKHELKSINEVERALKEHGFWSIRAMWNQFNRRMRIRIKNLMEVTGISIPVKIWRRYKWR